MYYDYVHFSRVIWWVSEGNNSNNNNNNLRLIMVKTNPSTLHTIYNIKQSAMQDSNNTTYRLSCRTAATTRFSPEGIGFRKVFDLVDWCLSPSVKHRRQITRLQSVFIQFCLCCCLHIPAALPSCVARIPHLGGLESLPLPFPSPSIFKQYGLLHCNTNTE